MLSRHPQAGLREANRHCAAPAAVQAQIRSKQDLHPIFPLRLYVHTAHSDGLTGHFPMYQPPKKTSRNLDEVNYLGPQ